MKTFKTLITEVSLWKFIYKKHKGEFWRGVSELGTGVGFGALGVGVYLTWEEGMAKAFAKQHGIGGIVKKFEVKRGLKMVDVQDKDFADVKKKMGFEPWEYSNSGAYATTLTKELEKLKYDGVVSDKVAEGIVVFNKKNVRELPGSGYH